MRVRKLDTETRRDVRQFVRFPFELYRDCSRWVPPLISGVKTDLDRRKHPFYRHSTADFFVAESEGQTLGRIAVMNNRNYNEYHQSRVAFFGLFEVVEDCQVTQALFDVALDWARAQGLDRIAGPKGLIGSDGGGVLVEGFEHQPAMGAAYNFPYYDAMIKDSGFEKDRDFYSAYFGLDQGLPERFYQTAEKLKARRNLWVKSFGSKRELREWVPRAVRAHAEAFSQNYTYYPPTPEEVEMVVATLTTVGDPRLIKLVLKGEEIIGVVLGVPNVTVGLQRAKGRLWPFGWFHILREQRRTKRADFPAMGLLPGYQGLGGHVLLTIEVMKTLLASNHESVELVLVEEENFKSRREVNMLNAMWYKTHRSYQRGL